jgi:hypothetical protein
MISMEQHAIPQDITGFKFKLVGDMTLKQFGELAAGAIVAYVFYASGWHPFLKWPLVISSGLMGFALAFLPIEERSLDIWITNFFRAIYRPTLYVWKKSATNPTGATLSLVSPTAVTKPKTPAPQLWPFPIEPLKPVGTPPPVEPTPATPTSPSPEPTPAPETRQAISGQPISIEDLQALRDRKVRELEQAVKKLDQVTHQVKTDMYQAQKGPDIVTVDSLAQLRDEKKAADEEALRLLIEQNKRLMDQIEGVKTRIQSLQGMDTTQLQTQLGTLDQQREKLATQISTFQEKINGPPVPATVPMTTQSETPVLQSQAAQPSVVRVVEKSVARQAAISLTDIPNVINGLVVNDRNVPLDSTILIIKDKAGNSIRALKTNQVGQFIASTPLENGTYYLEFERPSYSFDILEITLSGQVLQPLEIKGRSVSTA